MFSMQRLILLLEHKDTNEIFDPRNTILHFSEALTEKEVSLVFEYLQNKQCPIRAITISNKTPINLIKLLCQHWDSIQVTTLSLLHATEQAIHALEIEHATERSIAIKISLLSQDSVDTLLKQLKNLRTCDTLLIGALSSRNLIFLLQNAPPNIKNIEITTKFIPLSEADIDPITDVIRSSTLKITVNSHCLRFALSKPSYQITQETSRAYPSKMAARSTADITRALDQSQDLEKEAKRRRLNTTRSISNRQPYPTEMVPLLVMPIPLLLLPLAMQPVIPYPQTVMEIPIPMHSQPHPANPLSTKDDGTIEHQAETSQKETQTDNEEEFQDTQNKCYEPGESYEDFCKKMGFGW